MRIKLSAIGNSLGVVIEKPILELLDIDRDTELELTTDGQRLIIEPVRQQRKRLLASGKEGHGRSRSNVPQARRVNEEPEFLILEDVRILHEEQLARYDGGAGERDAGALDAAVAVLRGTSTASSSTADLERGRAPSRAARTRVRTGASPGR